MPRPPLRFEDKYSLSKRKRDARRVLQKFPTRIPVIVQAGKGVSDLPPVYKSKYLVPVDLKMGQFIAVIRSKLMLRPQQALFVMTKKKGVMPPTGALMITVYHENLEEDFFLYLDLYTENTFG